MNYVEGLSHVVPTHVGVNLSSLAELEGFARSPHARGGEPIRRISELRDRM